jgi:hypothetical protein
MTAPSSVASHGTSPWEYSLISDVFLSDEQSTLLDRICSRSADRSLLESVIGIGRWIPPEREAEFADALLNKRFQPRVDSDIRVAAFRLLKSEYENIPKEI